MGEVNCKIDRSQLENLTTFINDLGGQFSVQNQLTFNDLGLSELEKNIFQCLVCSKVIKRKEHAVKHFKKLHIVETELTCQCPRCNIEMPKSKLNEHMDKAHEIKAFNQMIKRNFKPETQTKHPTKISKLFLESDPLTMTHGDFNNNNIKTEQPDQEFEKKMIQEEDVSDFKTNSDAFDIRTEQKVVPAFENAFGTGETSKAPGLKVKKDLGKKKNSTNAAKIG